MTDFPRRRAALRMIASIARKTPVRARKTAQGLEFELRGEFGDANGIVAKNIIALLDENPRAKEIEVTINSAGGTVRDAIKIHHALVSHSAKVTTIADEVCASAATIVLAAGDVRLALPWSTLLLHSSEIPIQSADSKRWTAAEYSARAANLKALDLKILDLYAARCGHRNWFAREMQTESPLPLESAEIHGLIHGLFGLGSGMFDTGYGRAYVAAVKRSCATGR